MPVQDWQVLSPTLLTNLQQAGVAVDAVQIVAGECVLNWPPGQDHHN